MKLGCIQYINVLPVTLGLESNQVDFEGELIRGEPTHLNGLTRQGLLDVTAVSSIEYLSCWQTYRVVQGVGLSSPAAVKSVKLFSLLPISELEGQKVAVTRASATSRTLLQLLIPRLNVVDLEEARLSDEQPAVLLIGDQALTAEPAPYELDLGQAWRERTGLPMVFAVWLARRTLAQGPEELLHRSKEWGSKNWSKVLDEGVRRTGLPRATIEAYFAGMNYDLGPREMESLKLFYRMAAERGLAQAPAGLMEEMAWSV